MKWPNADGNARPNIDRYNDQDIPIFGSVRCELSSKNARPVRLQLSAVD